MQDLAEAIARQANAGLVKKNSELIQEWLDELQDINLRYLPEVREIEIDGEVVARRVENGDL